MKQEYFERYNYPVGYAGYGRNKNIKVADKMHQHSRISYQQPRIYATLTAVAMSSASNWPARTATAPRRWALVVLAVVNEAVAALENMVIEAIATVPPVLVLNQ